LHYTSPALRVAAGRVPDSTRWKGPAASPIAVEKYHTRAMVPNALIQAYATNRQMIVTLLLQAIKDWKVNGYRGETPERMPKRFELDGTFPIGACGWITRSCFSH
jgi:hypothetical protein